MRGWLRMARNHANLINLRNTMSYHHSQGLILLSVLIYLTILSLLALGALEASALQMRMLNNIKADHQLFVCTDTALQQIKHKLMQFLPAKCFIAEQSNRYYRDKNTAWWQAYACTISTCKNYKTFYLIENLIEQPCYKIDPFPVGAKYYRITVQTNSNNQNYQTVLQSTVLLPFISKQTCPTNQIKLHGGGQQSWRQIN